MLSLQAGEVISGTATRAETLRVRSGQVWITVEGISHDYFLHAGDCFTAVPGRLTVLQAEQDAGVEHRRGGPLQKLRGAAPVLRRLARVLTPAPVAPALLQRARGCSDAGC
ncbi:MAG TPA: DUF2917 domain-containing protein [Noviherbaspirillum sp.]|uniref:DUF2917 domain-containing protein n=1 Tax=Noviherbaspirillum sp. TaxID=1926288 RepID=UPI002F949E20